MPRKTCLSLLVATSLLAGCKTWRVETGATPEEYVRRERPEQVRVRRTDNTTLVLFNPIISGDSIRGAPTELAIRPVSVPLSEVSTVSTRRFSLGRTVLMVVGVAGGLIVYDLLMSLNEGI